MKTVLLSGAALLFVLSLQAQTNPRLPGLDNAPGRREQPSRSQTFQKITPAPGRLEQPAFFDATQIAGRTARKIFATGTEDVIVWVHGRETPSDVYVRCENWTTNRWLGHFQKGREATINLGKLPTGEIIFSIKSPMFWDHVLPLPKNRFNVYENSDTAPNPDGKNHCFVTDIGTQTRAFTGNDKRTFPCVGTVKYLQFEDTWMTPNEMRQHWFTDIHVAATGGVTIEQSTIDFIKLSREQTGEVRDAAIAALKATEPRFAASLSKEIATRLSKK